MIRFVHFFQFLQKSTKIHTPIAHAGLFLHFAWPSGRTKGFPGWIPASAIYFTFHNYNIQFCCYIFILQGFQLLAKRLRPSDYNTAWKEAENGQTDAVRTAQDTPMRLWYFQKFGFSGKFYCMQRTKKILKNLRRPVSQNIAVSQDLFERGIAIIFGIDFSKKIWIMLKKVSQNFHICLPENFSYVFLEVFVFGMSTELYWVCG